MKQWTLKGNGQWRISEIAKCLESIEEARKECVRLQDELDDPPRPAFNPPPKPELVLFRPKNGSEPAQWAVRKCSGDVVASDGYCWPSMDVDMLDDAGNVIEE
jgi:hypothetical protein